MQTTSHSRPPTLATRIEDLEIALAFLNEDEFAPNNEIVRQALSNVLARSDATRDLRGLPQQPPRALPPPSEAPPEEPPPSFPSLLEELRQAVFDAARKTREARARLESLQQCGASAEDIAAAEEALRDAKEKADRLTAAFRVLTCQAPPSPGEPPPTEPSMPVEPPPAGEAPPLPVLVPPRAILALYMREQIAAWERSADEIEERADRLREVGGDPNAIRESLAAAARARADSRLLRDFVEASEEAGDLVERIQRLRSAGAPVGDLEAAARRVGARVDELFEQLRIQFEVDLRGAAELVSDLPPSPSAPPPGGLPPTEGTAAFRIARFAPDEVGFEFSASTCPSFIVSGFTDAGAALETVETLRREAGTARVQVELQRPPSGKPCTPEEVPRPGSDVDDWPEPSRPEVASVFEIYPVEGKDLGFRLRHAGELLLQADGLKTPQAAREAIQALRARLGNEAAIERGQGEAGFSFMVRGNKREVLATGIPQRTAEARERVVAMAREAAPKALVREL